MENVNIEKFNKWIGRLFEKVFPGAKYDYKDKDTNAGYIMAYMLDRTQSMFQYENLPDTIPQRILELFLQTRGVVAFHKVNGELYIFTGGLGGEPDVYYRPTIFTVANPALNYSKNLKIGEECELLINDSMLLGLMPMFARYASQMTESELSLQIAIINSRVVDLISASDDATEASAKKFLQDIEKGELGVIGENAFLDGVRVQPYGGTGRGNQLTQVIEAIQYLKASWFNELGINANYNMKRESLNTSESQLNNDALLPLVDDMLRCREKGLEKVNAMFGTDIKVKLASSWEDNQKELDAAQENIEQAQTNETTEPEEKEDIQEVEENADN